MAANPPQDVPLPTAAEALAMAPSDTSAHIGFVLKLGAALHKYGAPAHRLEGMLSDMCSRLGVRANFFSTPTAIFASFGAPDELRTGMIRVDPGELDLGRLADIDELAGRIIQGQATTAQGASQLDDVLKAPDRYRPWAVLVCHVIAATAGARLFGGGSREALVAALIGLVVGPLSILSRRTSRGRVVELAAAPVATIIAVAMANWFGPLSVEVSTVAGLIILLPGLSLTIALNEIATRNLLSGTARLTASALVFLQLAFGVGLGGRLAAFVFDRAVPVITPSPPAWTMALAIPGAALSVVVLFRARWRDAPWVLAAAATAYVGARLGAALLGPELGAFMGALALGSFSNLTARSGRPAVVTTVPGLITLVPGAIGFRSLEALIQKDAMAGVQSAFTVALVGVGIVAGLLLATAVLPPRRSL